MCVRVLFKESTRFAFFTRTFHNVTQLSSSSYTVSHTHTVIQTNRQIVHQPIQRYIYRFPGLLEASRILSTVLEPSGTFWNIRGLSRPAVLCPLSATRCRLAKPDSKYRGLPATRQAVDTGNFQRPHSFVYDFVLARGITRCLADVI